MEHVVEWQSRPLDAVYPIVYLDCIVLKIRQDRQVINKAVYLALGVNFWFPRSRVGIHTLIDTLIRVSIFRNDTRSVSSFYAPFIFPPTIGFRQRIKAWRHLLVASIYRWWNALGKIIHTFKTIVDLNGNIYAYETWS